ncbi:MAG TPA: pseudouridine-5'-phosphate glycosidase [Gemmatimonadaceae bacterium]|nr:pseudouridine-5'-phosphate glycosidase [Gemmatimonadaceae bacterium]
MLAHPVHRQRAGPPAAHRGARARHAPVRRAHRERGAPPLSRADPEPRAPVAQEDSTPAVLAALALGQPVVALESSVLAQGLPIPANREAYRRMRTAVERGGAVAAVTAVVRGRPSLGLDGADLERFLAREGVRKVSARDLGWAMAHGEDGATTVAATLALATRWRIPVFATGGIGGVHREPADAHPSGWVRDESADLLELARSPVIVVCAGAKSILDLPATLERLETLGVPVVGYRTDELPGFFTAATGLPLAMRAESAEEIARTFLAGQRLGRPGALLVVQPPPADVALEREAVDEAVRAALVDARLHGVQGPAVTPFLLAAVERATGGQSLAANLGLLERNAALAAEIAVALQRLAGEPADDAPDVVTPFAGGLR